MSKGQIIPTGLERQFSVDEMFFSVTDSRGIIKLGNSVFERVAAYSKEEIVGAPHNIIRHPDMPRAVFKLLWDYIENGRSIVAYVKNLAKDGGHYWVLAYAMPISGGFLSVRLKPTSDLLPVVENLYRQARTMEIHLGDDGPNRKNSMKESLNFIVSEINKLGFDSYDAFMEAALRQELLSRDLRKSRDTDILVSENISKRDLSHYTTLEVNSRRISDRITELFSKVSSLDGLNSGLFGKSNQISLLANKMHFLSINASIESELLGSSGTTLTVVSNHLGSSSERITKQVLDLSSRLSTIYSKARLGVFSVATIKMQIEMMRYFINCILSGKEDQALAQQMISILFESLRDVATKGMADLSKLDVEMTELRMLADLLRNSMQALQFVHLNGKIESAKITTDCNFGVVLSEVKSRASEANGQVAHILEAMKPLPGFFEACRSTEVGVNRALHNMGETVSAWNASLV